MVALLDGDDFDLLQDRLNGNAMADNGVFVDIVVDILSVYDAFIGGDRYPFVCFFVSEQDIKTDSQSGTDRLNIPMISDVK